MLKSTYNLIGINNLVFNPRILLKLCQIKKKSILNQLNSSQYTTIENNRKKLIPILSSIIFCATHDIAVGGKSENNGNFHDLLQFRIEAGDIVLSAI